MTRRSRRRPEAGVVDDESAVEVIRQMEDRIASRREEAERAEKQMVAARHAAEQLMEQARAEAVRAAGAERSKILAAARAEATAIAVEAAAQAKQLHERAARRRQADVATVLDVVLGADSEVRS